MYSVIRIPEGAKRVSPVDGQFIIAKGEVTGHAHRIEVKEGMELYEHEEILYLKYIGEAPMVHEEHRKVLVDPGITAFEIVREKDHFNDLIRRVLD